MNAPFFTPADAGCDHGSPGMTVGIGKISGVAAVIGLMRWFQQRRTFRDRKFQHRIDLIHGAAVPGQRHPAKGLRTRMLRQRHVLRELIPREKPDCPAAGLEEPKSLAGSAKLSRKTKRFVK